MWRVEWSRNPPSKTPFLQTVRPAARHPQPLGRKLTAGRIGIRTQLEGTSCIAWLISEEEVSAHSQTLGFWLGYGSEVITTKAR